ncbi:hypothetical protein [Actinocrispum sp. NPDC049592]|uniref:hypothetical protein n=1 Tax=Actinocrispum sp. NPDC049592 TaxID=3154835 RepID=UPI003429318A
MKRIAAVIATLVFGLGYPAAAAQPDAVNEFLGGPVTVSTEEVPVYYLSADFVRSGALPVAVLQYTAKTATGADGRVATVWTANGQVANIASGDDESRYAKAAGPGATIFREPQVNAWYALRGDSVVPLNASARGTVGTGVSVSAYQRLVHAKYADKQPGSQYAKDGAAGGYAPEPAPARSSLGWPIGGGLLAVVVIAGLVMTRRRSLR